MSSFTPRIDEDGVPRCIVSTECDQFKGPAYCAVLRENLPIPPDLAVCEGWARAVYGELAAQANRIDELGALLVQTNIVREKIEKDADARIHQLQAANTREVERRREAERKELLAKAEARLLFEALPVPGKIEHHPTLKVKRLQHGEGLPLPSYATDGSAGLDLCTADDTMAYPGTLTMVRTGLCVEIPPGYEGQIRPKSGLAKRLGIDVFLGTIDSDYRGEIVVMMTCTAARHVSKGAKIAQLVISPVARVEVVEVEELSETERGDGGFGSTGR